jgi:hypothetical protein
MYIIYVCMPKDVGYSEHLFNNGCSAHCKHDSLYEQCSILPPLLTSRPKQRLCPRCVNTIQFHFHFKDIMLIRYNMFCPGEARA